MHKSMLNMFMAGIITLTVMMPFAFADVYINVMAVNGAPETKETPVHYNLPGDLKSEDILDTNGLQLDYNVNDVNYFVHGVVRLEPKESKTFRIRIRDIWKLTTQQTTELKEDILKGFEQIGKPIDPDKAEALKDQLNQKLDFIIAQSAQMDSIERRMDMFRMYRAEMERIKESALAVDYWRSDPGDTKERIIRFKIEVENPTTSTSKSVKEKHYMPSEVRPKDVVESEGFEVRFDPLRRQSFLFKEEDIPIGDKKIYTIGIRDIWIIPQKEIDYLRNRAKYSYGFLKNSKYGDSAKTLHDHAEALLGTIEGSQSQALDIKEHISAFRANMKSFDEAKSDVENLEKLLSLYREELEKSKVENVLQKIKSLDGVAAVSKQMFEKKPTPSTTWNFIGYILIALVVLTGAYFGFLMIFGNKGKTSSQEKK